MLEKIMEEIDAYIEEYHKPPYETEEEAAETWNNRAGQEGDAK